MTDGDTPRMTAGTTVFDADGGGTWGEAELVRRCADRGEMGAVGTIPEACQNWGPPRGAPYCWTED